jgi:hypothetical protein
LIVAGPADSLQAHEKLSLRNMKRHAAGKGRPARREDANATAPGSAALIARVAQARPLRHWWRLDLSLSFKVLIIWVSF